jgi:hypothetical protein
MVAHPGTADTLLHVGPLYTNMKNLIALLLRTTALHAVLVSYHQWRLRAALALMKKFGSDTKMPVWCSARFQRHQRALLRLGTLIEREFALTRRAICGPEPYRAFRDLMRARFSDGCWSCAASGGRIIVVAPTSQIPEWEQFVSEYDLQAV